MPIAPGPGRRHLLLQVVPAGQLAPGPPHFCGCRMGVLLPVQHTSEPDEPPHVDEHVEKFW